MWCRRWKNSVGVSGGFGFEEVDGDDGRGRQCFFGKIGIGEVRRRVGAEKHKYVERAIGGGLKLTTGVISGLPDASTEDMFLLDIRVNPGNSGGPLCNSAGSVVGMVTARTLAGSDVDSYGMAIPAQTVETFLRRYIPRYESATPLDVSGGWDQVDAAVNRSVLRVLKVQ